MGVCDTGELLSVIKIKPDGMVKLECAGSTGCRVSNIQLEVHILVSFHVTSRSHEEVHVILLVYRLNAESVL